MVAFFVVFTFVAFILADGVVQWIEVRREEKRGGAGRATLRPALALEGISIPGGIFVDSGHTWVGLDATGRARVGMDRFVQKALGRIDRIDLPEEGKVVRRGDELFALGQGARRAVLTSPIDGVVGKVNRSLAGDPEVLEMDPYLKGWVCTLNPSNLAEDLRQLSIAGEAKEWLKREARRFQDFIAGRPLAHPEMGSLMADGGEVAEGVLESMDEETWQLFAREFLGRHPSEKSHP